MILPKKDSQSTNGETAKVVKEPGVKLPTSASTPNIKGLQIGVKVDVKPYSCKQNFKCPPSELYNVLTLTELMRAFTSAPAQVNSSVGGKFSLFDGQITGKFTELVRTSDKFLFVSCLELLLFSFNQVPNKKIVQEWRFKTWPEGHHSKVTIELEDEGDSTNLSLNQTGIPTK